MPKPNCDHRSCNRPPTWTLQSTLSGYVVLLLCDQHKALHERNFDLRDLAKFQAI